ncbi:hypothetical protein M758_1G119200 [Ceratodon purpureus]|nr:hypothetical protein M758_1G119200 [Ceratodon purpureus]
MAASVSGAGGGESCPICLEPVVGEAFLDQCFHRFCYHCILQWSEMVLAAALAKSGNPKRVASLECPLCKTHYTSIIHDLVSGTKFQRDFLLASDGSQFRLSEAHRRRLAVYASHKADGASLSASVVADLDAGGVGVSSPRGVKSRAVSGVVKVNKWLPCWVRRELQALMQDEDVNMVTQHVAGVVESLQKRSRGSMFRPGGAKEPCSKAWCSAVAAAVRPFVFEDAEMFAVELWKFLDAGIDIAFYDQLLVDTAAGSDGGQEGEGGADEKEGQGVVLADVGEKEGHGVAADSENARPVLSLLDEDVEDG